MWGTYFTVRLFESSIYTVSKLVLWFFWFLWSKKTASLIGTAKQLQFPTDSVSVCLIGNVVLPSVLYPLLFWSKCNNIAVTQCVLSYPITTTNKSDIAFKFFTKTNDRNQWVTSDYWYKK